MAVVNDRALYPIMTESDKKESSLIDPRLIRESLSSIVDSFPLISLSPFTVLVSADSSQSIKNISSPYRLESKGIQRFVRHHADINLALIQISKRSDEPILVESIVFGKGFWLLGQITDGKLNCHGYAEAKWHDDVHQFPMALTYPARVDETDRIQLEEFGQTMVDLMSLSDGPLRLEWCKSTVADQYHLLGAYKDSSMCTYFNDQSFSAVAVQWLYSHSGIVKSVDGVEEARAMSNIKVVDLTVSPGDHLGHVLDIPSRDALGYVVAQGNTIEEASKSAQLAADLITIHIQTVL